ncbi:MAG: helix-turn-helix domain-containing protein [Actinomycetota bacterium]
MSRRVAPQWEAMVAQVAELVRRDLTADLSTAALSESVHVSAFHFHRIFAAVTGETPAAFVRRARLERAAKVMAAAPDRRLTDIAFDVGLSSPSELSRSFRRAHGMAPSDLEPGRRWAGEGAIPEPPDLSGLTEVVSLTARRLAVVRARGVIGLDDLSEPYRRLVDWCGEAGLGDAWQLIGACWDDHETTPSIGSTTSSVPWSTTTCRSRRRSSNGGSRRRPRSSSGATVRRPTRPTPGSSCIGPGCRRGAGSRLTCHR